MWESKFLVFSFRLWLFATFCEAFTPLPGSVQRIFKAPTMMRKTDSKTWAPIVPKVVDLSNGSLVTEHGVEKSEFEDFFSKIESSSYFGYKWELVDNNVVIYDMVDMPHEKAASAFEFVITREALLGGWDDYLQFGGSGKLKNSAPNDSNWQPDNSYFPAQRRGPIGSYDETTRFPTMVLEVATSESDEHVFSKAHKYLGPSTTIQIVVVLLVRPKLSGADRLQVLKFERGQQNPCWQRSFEDPVCTRAGDPAFRLPISVHLLFDNAPIPVALAGGPTVELDLYLWKKRLSWT